ncbi:hypothetical protein HN960_00480 [Candidatus Peregrinibacteria bacterium]|jgi:hypothetical protein|nr:hypothetical protein [Candidatus Peregrinibacteria bacterium]MBT4585974.1 hypothetical protein [Candidatus Peregrinibacteria bacterium]MBT6730766.1 hypothetical protein [Candidatus Peregrinibacteria bacterium]MBT7008902.1 hypothetical protein [Candidatus Peregrinibacteria bacterium]MBT7344647.1 hypothetical protein [Candidatus Peregrinibacteria bacterium]
MNLHINKVFGLILAVAGSIALLTILILFTGTVTILSRHPADFLPAAETVLFMQNVNSDDVVKYSDVFDGLIKIEETEPFYLSLINTNDEQELFWFSKSKAKPQLSNHWPYQVNSFSGAALPEINKVDRLSNQNAYRVFQKYIHPNQKWIYAKRSMVPNRDLLELAAIDQLLLRDASDIGITENEPNKAVFQLFSDAQYKSNIKNPPKVNGDTAISLSIFNLSKRLNELRKNMSTNQSDFLFSLLRKKTFDMFGSSVSFEYDIMPLMQNEMAFLLEQNGSGGTLFCISGNGERSSTVERTLQRMTKGRYSELSSNELIDIQLSNRFRIKTLKSIPYDLESDESEYKGWQIKSLQGSTEMSGLFAAQKDKKYVLSNSKIKLIEAIDKEDENAMFITKDSEIIGGKTLSAGWISLSKLSSVINNEELEWRKGLLYFLNQEAKELEWKEEARGNIRRVEIEAK